MKTNLADQRMEAQVAAQIAVLERIKTDVDGDTARLVQLAETFAWLSSTNQAHG